MKIVDREIRDLIPAEYNPRHLSQEQAEHLEASLKRFGAVDPAIINTHPDRKNIIIGGHQRLKTAQRLGWETFPCVELELDKEKERELNIRLNKNTGGWDYDALANYFEVEELTEWGFSDEELFGDIEAEEVEAEEDNYEEPEDIKVDVVLGDLIEIGPHRLLCGDSTDSDQVAKLMNGEKADMVLSDPPYGMFLEADYSSLNWGDRKGKKYDNVIGDHEDFDPKLINTFFKHFDYCKEMFLWGADYYFELLPEFKKGNYIVWDKTLQSNGDAGSNSEYELCWSRQKHKRVVIHFNWFRYFGLQSQDTKTRLHPTQKPLEVNKHFIENYSKEKECIIDLYLGSGSTMVASHQLKRKCYGMELDPKYCQVIIDRMKKLDDTLEIKINGEPYGV
jgi:DNA modification methylase